ncbi:MAG: CPBP family intramembrane metalloprotease [Clostridia bacterium]|nr:CPBP family intramembrane metalloprotease [Clostridia bacterium]
MRDDFYRRTYQNNDSTDYSYENNTQGDYYGAPNDENLKCAKRTFSRIGFSLSAFTTVAYAVVLLTYLVLIIFFKDYYQAITENIYFTWLMNFIPMYLIAFPTLFLIVKGMPVVKRRKNKIGLDEFVLLFFISQGIMTMGNLAGITLNNLISGLLGKEIDNTVSELIQNSPMWIIVLVVVVVGPIVEELIFRKLMIDRLGIFSDRLAVIVSSIAFGLFHGNLYQFFYAAGLGLVLGYIYTKTRNILYPILMHMIINFMGSVVAIPVSNCAVQIEEMSQTLASGGEIDLYSFTMAFIILFSYVILEYGMAIAGIIILVKQVGSHAFYVSSVAEIKIPKRQIASVSLLNAGAIIFLVISLLQFLSNIFLS